MQGILQWLESLPPALLYAAIAVIGAVENFFPPLPADTAVALGAFLAARGGGSAVGIWVATLVGNVAGATAMYAVGRRFGAARLERRLLGARGAAAEHRLRDLYGRYGISALVLSRFLPGVRAIVPPFAGALRVPPVRAFLAIALASAVWYGLVSYLGYSLGSWQRIRTALSTYGRWLAGGAVLVASGAALVWWLRRRRARRVEIAS